MTGAARKLILPDEMPAVATLQVPRDFYQILPAPTPLAGMPHPDLGFPWTGLVEAGFRHVVCLAGSAPAYDPRPLNLLYACELEDLYGGVQPSEPEREARLVREAVSAIRSALQQEEGVAVHCQGGTGRSGTVLGAALCHLGIAPREVIAYLDRLNRSRGRPGWPESPWQAELLLSFHQ